MKKCHQKAIAKALARISSVGFKAYTGAFFWQFTDDRCAGIVSYFLKCLCDAAAQSGGVITAQFVSELFHKVLTQRKFSSLPQYSKDMVVSFIDGFMWQIIVDAGSLLTSKMTGDNKPTSASQIAITSLILIASYYVLMNPLKRLFNRTIDLFAAILGSLGFYLEGPANLGNYSPAGVRTAPVAALFDMLGTLTGLGIDMYIHHQLTPREKNIDAEKVELLVANPNTSPEEKKSSFLRSCGRCLLGE